jgi:predicted MFS family arabinose efflux permease
MMTRILGWSTLFLIGTDLFVISPMLPEIATDLKVGPALAGLAVTVFALAYLAGGPTLGALADRRGHVSVLAGSLLLFALANLASGLAPSLPALLAARAVAGLAASGITPSVFALISAAAPAGRRASWLATITSGLLLALTTGAPAGSLLASALGWHATFAVLAGAAIAVLLATMRAARSRPAGPAGTGHAGPAQARERSKGSGPTTPARLRAVSVTSLWALAVYGVYTYLGTILTTDMHASAATVAAALACYGVGALAGNLAGGRLTDQLGARRVRLASLTGLTTALAILAGALHAGTGPVVAALTLLGLAAYPFFTAQQAWLSVAFRAASGSILAWNNSAMYGGILTGAALGGLLLHARGPTALVVAAVLTALLATLAATYSVPSRARLRRSSGDPLRGREEAGPAG